MNQKSVVDLLKIFYKLLNGGLAQLVEQLTLNQRVGGSNPPASTSFLICPRGDTRGQSVAFINIFSDFSEVHDKRFRDRPSQSTGTIFQVPPSPALIRTESTNGGGG